MSLVLSCSAPASPKEPDGKSATGRLGPTAGRQKAGQAPKKDLEVSLESNLNLLSKLVGRVGLEPTTR